MELIWSPLNIEIFEKLKASRVEIQYLLGSLSSTVAID